MEALGMLFGGGKPTKVQSMGKLHRDPTPSEKQQSKAKLNESSNPRLKLKDYLQLNTLKKKTNTTINKSASDVIKVEDVPQASETKKNLMLLKQELKNDMQKTILRMQNLLEAVSKMKEVNEEQQYDELVYFCELHRRIKEDILSNIEKNISSVNDHQTSLMMKLLIKTKSFTDSQALKAPSPPKRKRKLKRQPLLR